MKVDTLTPIVPAAPGETARCRVRVLNDTGATTSYRVRVVGLDGDEVAVPLAGPIPPGHAADVDVDIDVPETYAAGNHALALEVTSTRRDERPHITDLMLSVDSTERVVLTVVPSMITGRRSKRFNVYVDNREPDIADLRLTGSGPGLRVRLEPGRVVLRPGERARIRGKVTGPARLARDPVQHVLTVAASGGAVPVYATAAFRQHPFLPRRLRTGIAFLALLGIWVGIAAGAVLYLRSRQDDKAAEPVAVVPVTATTQPGGTTPGTTPGGEPGTGTDGTGTGTDGQPGDDGEEPGAPSKDRKTLTSIGGKVKAGKTGDNADVIVQIVSRGLEAPSPDPSTKIVGSRAGLSAPKVWPSRYGAHRGTGLPSTRQTESIISFRTGEDGAWAFPDVPIRDTYEVKISKDGFDPQTFVVIPSEDGKPVELDVELVPGSGRIEGRVSSPGGAALGNVDIVVSDGTVTYSTTSSTTEGEVGSFEVAGVGTPANYTLIASRRGYGTEVLQLPLTPGQAIEDVAIAMELGVGSIAGTVRAATGEALGGVTVTAANADLSRTTTSLTLGIVGSYHIPQMPIPGEYTVTATAEGYVPQTRLVDLEGNRGSIDFQLTRTTGSISGRVVSSKDGPISGAVVRISRDDLVFETSTAVEPVRGSFSVDDLPPGEYVVEVIKFNHADWAEIVNVGVGAAVDLGEVGLTYSVRPNIPQTGSVEVTITDNEGATVVGSNVSLTKVGGGTAPDPKVDTSGDGVTFSPVDVGTYVLSVNRTGYKTVETRISVGLDVTKVPISLYRLGQASGSLIDAITREPLSNYQFRILRVLRGGTTEVVQAAKNPTYDAARGWEWQSDANSLQAGSYRVEVINAVGYVSPSPRDFEIPLEAEDVVTTAPMVANPYPTLRGRLYRPVVNDAGQVTFSPLNASPTVTLRCGTTIVPVSTLDDDLEPFGGAGSVDGYTFTKEQLWDFVPALGTCTVRVELTGYVAAEASVTLAPFNGIDQMDRWVNVALLGSVGAFGGLVYWLDDGPGGRGQIDLTGVDIASETPAIVGYDGIAALPQGTNPTPDTESLSTENTTAGIWSLPGQLFGTTVYSFTHPSTGQGRVRVVIDANGRRVEAVSGVTLPTNPLVTPAPLGTVPPVEVRLQANPGTVSGQVDLLTTSTKSYTPSLVTATGPGGSRPVVFSDTIPGEYSITGAAAGTWSLVFNTPAHFEPFGTAADGDFLDPGGTLEDQDAAFYELGDLTVTVTDSEGNEIAGDGPTVVVAHTTTGAAGDPADSSRSRAVDDTADTDGNNVVGFRDLPVNNVEPVDDHVVYTVNVTMTGYDNLAAEITVSDRRGALDTYTGNSASIPVQLLAGTDATVTVKLPELGVISTSVVGRIGPAQEELDVDDLTIEAARVLDEDGELLDDEETALVEKVDFNTFTVAGLPGYYRIEVKHPEFEDDPISVPTTDLGGYYRLQNAQTNDLDLIGPFVLAVKRGSLDVTAVTSRTTLDPVGGATVGVIRDASVDVDDDTIEVGAHELAVDDPVVFLPLPGSVFPADLTADVTYYVVAVPDEDSFQVSTSLGGAPVALASAGALRWYREVTLDATGQTVIDDLVPGTYDVLLRHRVGGEDQNFPVLVPITIPRDEDDADRIVTLVAPMPEIGGGIEGMIVAENEFGFAVSLPASVTVDREYEQPRAERNGSDVDNELSEGDLTTVPLTEITVTRHPTVPETPQPFEFTGLAAGRHTVGFSDADGYDPPSPQSDDHTVTGLVPTDLGEIVYTARRVDVYVTVQSSNGRLIDTAVVTLTTPRGVVKTAARTATPGQYVFTGIVPEMPAHRLKIDDELHRPLAADPGEDVFIPPQPTGELDLLTRTLTADASKISGVLRKQESTGTPGVPVVSEGAVRLLRQTRGVVQVGTDQTPSATGTFDFVVAEEGSYLVEGELDGHATRRVTVAGISLGNYYSAPTLTVPKLATVTVTVDGPSSTDPSLAVVLVEPADVTVTPTRSGREFEFADLDPDDLYRFEASATGWYTRSVPATGTYDPGIGATDDLAVTLLQRRIEVTVDTSPEVVADEEAAELRLYIPGTSPTYVSPSRSGNVYTFLGVPTTGTGRITVHIDDYLDQEIAVGEVADVDDPVQEFDVTMRIRTVSITVTTDGTANDAKTATVSIEIPAGTQVATQTGTGGSNVYSFSVLPPGAGVVKASRSGYRPNEVTLPDGHTFSDGITLKPEVTISGKVRNADNSEAGSITVRFTDGVTNRTATTAANGNYTLGGFTIGAWRVYVDEAGVGTDEEFVTVTATSANSVTGVDLKFDPRPIDFTFEVKNPAGAPVGSATVDFDSGPSDDTDANGLVDLTIDEDQPLGFTVTKTGYIDYVGTATLADTDVDVTLIPLPDLSGTVVTPGPTDTLEGSVTVYLCAGRIGHDCVSATADRTDTTGASGAALGVYDFAAVGVGDWTVRSRKVASGQTTQGFIEINVSSTGVLTVYSPGPADKKITLTPAVDVSGFVVKAAANVDDADVWICAGDVTSISVACDKNHSLQSVSSDDVTGYVVDDLDGDTYTAGTYTIWAKKGADQGRITIELLRSGAIAAPGNTGRTITIS